LKIADCRLAIGIGDCRLPIGGLTIGDWAITNQHSSIRRSPLLNRQLSIGNRQSPIGND